MKDRRAPIDILTEDCCPSFFTVPVFRSNILPDQAEDRHNELDHSFSQNTSVLKSISHCFHVYTVYSMCWGVCIRFIPVLLFSAVESCSLSFSVSSGWSWSYREEPSHSDWDWLRTGVRESETYTSRPVSHDTTKRKPSAASKIRCFSSYRHTHMAAEEGKALRITGG